MNTKIIVSFFIILILLAIPLKGLPENTPIIIGVPTGLGSIEGRDAWRAVQLAVKEINKKGGIKLRDGYHPIKAFSIDTRGAEAGVPVYDALMAVERLILEKKPTAIVVGASRSEVLLASMDLIAKYRIPYICTIALTPDFEKRMKKNRSRYRYMFRLSIDAKCVISYFARLLEFLNEEYRLEKSAYIIVQDVLWTRETGNALKRILSQKGWKIKGLDIYPMGSSDFSSSLFKIRYKRARVILAFFDMPGSSIMIKQIHSMRINSILCGIISPATPEYAWNATGGAVEGMLGFVLEPGPIPIKKIPASVRFNKEYGRFWGEEARKKLSCHGAGYSYDAVYVLANAIERAGTTDPDRIVKELEKVDIQGVVGRIRFSKEHQLIFGYDPAKAAIGCIFQWKRPGIRVPVFPLSIAEGRIIVDTKR